MMIILAAFFVCSISTGYAQKAAEVYIPIGQSPGISGKSSSVVGTIESVDKQNMTITVKSGSETYTGKIAEKTVVYLDRNKSQKKNTTGNLEDCRAGIRCEMKYSYEDHQQTDKVDWIKIEWDE